MKIGGDIMASQKLMFLKKIDKTLAIEVVKKLRGADGAIAAPPAATASSTGTSGAATSGAAPKAAKAPAIMKALAERIAKTPGLVKEVGAVVGLVVTGPDAPFTVDLKNGAGSVKEGGGAADLTLKLSDDDLQALANGENLRDLYQRGRIRLDGDARLAQKLNFWKGLV